MWRPEESCTLLQDAISRGETVVFSCRCSVRYSGRAESHLPLGDRIVLIKADKSILIHQPTGSMPVNYMKAQASHIVSVENGRLLLKSRSIAHKEALDLSIERIHFLNSQRMDDAASVSIAGTEDDMAQMIYDTPELVEEGFKPASREEQTKYGFIDVMGTDRNGTLTIIECKRYTADLAAVTQLRRYVEKISQSKGIEKVRGILAAPKITSNAEKMLNDWGFEFKSITPPKYLEEFDAKQVKLDSF